MKAFQFLDIEFQKKAIEISKMKSDSYDVAVGGEAQAQRMLLEALRVFYKWVMVPKVIAKFLAMKVGIIAEPISPLIPKAAPPPEAKTPNLTIAPEGNRTNEGSSSTTT